MILCSVETVLVKRFNDFEKDLNMGYIAIYTEDRPRSDLAGDLML